MAYCPRCDRYFPHDRALEQHEENSSNHNICCGTDFSSALGLKEHYVQSPRHHYCQYCDRHFGSENGFLNHMEAVHWYCPTHRKVFNSKQGLTEHYRQSSEHSEKHFYCAPCNRIFNSESNLTSHLNSSTHQPRNIRCPGEGCSRAFVSISALALHFESGTCPSGLTRDELDRRAVRADRNNWFTNPSRLIAGPGGYEAPSTSTWATERSWNSAAAAYECFLCHSTFSTLRALNSHLQSPRHAEKIYRCPKSDCMQEFRALSSLCQHVESGRCGVQMFKQVQNLMNGLKNGMRSIGY
ncbi:hypothetical protein BV25DRAFT_1867740 [Artomyces pyxidatus]|uniref:Uncharacterized protein n=1 Tax=Artomyces pyxidatus TaxID=48021 RepID=A0ACB8TFK3_9AGAM|nr:hypothetical protein BV25DRAFT_1867740 [Artomyces pyxidatus]